MNMKYALMVGGVLVLFVAAWLIVRDNAVTVVDEDVQAPVVVEDNDEAPESDVVSPDADGRLVLGVGETGRVDELELTFNEMVADYRCPANVQCIEAGAVVAGVTTRIPGEGRTFNMPSDEVPQEIGEYRISIEEVAPPMQSEAMLDPLAYEVTFLVEQEE